VEHHTLSTRGQKMAYLATYVVIQLFKIMKLMRPENIRYSQLSKIHILLGVVFTLGIKVKCGKDKKHQYNL